ncbi:MAG: A/G-specific adenine glycosylase [Wenzhouxiangellaceae bacterium]|nr:A/G-specific adenine glycosylase [Wenzhouxiangellaceae bacterium]
MEPTFADRLLNWWQENGRHDLPWQHPRTAYRVWISEIMLQQTRVETVVGYFQRFMQRFPTVDALARVPLDDVLAAWSGLGYYARARNLHAAARELVAHHGGELPGEIDALEALPGIGRSTAAAIVAQAFDRRAVILDGNVKRVLARHAGIDGWPGQSSVQRLLWQEADRRTPPGRAAAYTQAIMDLGATLCRPKQPDCAACPVADDCKARLDGRVHELPAPRPARTLPERSQRFLVARDGRGRILLARRPPTGIWGGLWCLPELDVDSMPALHRLSRLDPLRHVFSHFALTMHFEHGRWTDESAQVNDDDSRWFETEAALALGLPRPVRVVIEALCAMPV